MDKAKQKGAPARREKLDSADQMNTERETGPKYDSGLTPLLWLAIPFILVMLYGLLT